MRPVSVSFEPATTPSKRLKAVFVLDNGRTKTIQFGSSGGSTFIEHKNMGVRAAWLARHAVRGTFDQPMSASALSRWVLWEKPTLRGGKAAFRKRFGL
jgi:hypothetical protein